MMMSYHAWKTKAAEEEGIDRISRAMITWVDETWEYETEVENNEGMEDDRFEAWIRKDAKALADEDAARMNTTCEEVTGIDFEFEAIDPYERWRENYEADLEYEWELRTGR